MMTGRRPSVWTMMSGDRQEFEAGRKVRMATAAICGPAKGMNDAAGDAN